MKTGGLLRPRKTWVDTALVLTSGAAAGYFYRFQQKPHENEQLHPERFQKFVLAGREPVSSTASIFTLQPSTRKADGVQQWEEPKRSVWSVQLKQPELQIARAYTPLPRVMAKIPSESLGDDCARSPGDIALLIRRETGGEVSTYLHKLPLTSLVEVRGPHHEFEIPSATKRVLFLAGGTGIVPALQTAAALMKESDTVVHILWANRKAEDCKGFAGSETTVKPASLFQGWFARKVDTNPHDDGVRTTPNPLVQTLESLRRDSAERISVQVFVDEENKFITFQNVARALNRLRPADSGPPEKHENQILIAGPDAFVEHWAGRKQWANGRETQGKLGGVLGGMDLRDWSVWKL